MTDELDKDKLEQPGGDAAVVPAAPAVDDWATAFASLEEPATPAAASDASGSAPAAGDSGGVPDASGAAPAADAGPVGGDAVLGADNAGGSVPAAPGAGEEGGEPPVDVEATIKGYTTELETRAINETAQMFADRVDDQGRKLIRQTGGKLGATINDTDIYRVDPDTGAPQFFNPDTGRAFTGDNPRAQAKAWVDAYNEELRETFNRLSGERQEQLETEMAPVIELLKFTPTFEKLDKVRQQMLEALIEDYEVLDAAGEHIGYSCDLNKALAQVNKQVASLQAGRAAAPAAPVAPTGPALDMPNTGGSTGTRPEFKTLAEAMEWDQDQQLAKGRKK